MKDYKRLTERDEFGNADIIGVDSERLASNLDFDELNKLTFALNQFDELEDKIESGEIDYVADRDKQIARLTAENAELRATLSKMETVEKELRAKLDKAVELPTIYEHISYPYVERMYSETIYYVIYKENGRIMTEKFGKNKSKAEARLKEIQKENND